MRRLRQTVSPAAAAPGTPGIVSVGSQVIEGTKVFSESNDSGGAGAIALMVAELASTGFGFFRVSRTSGVLSAISTEYGFSLPARSKIVACRMEVMTALTGGGTTTNVGFGHSGDPDAFGFAALTQGATSKWAIQHTPVGTATILTINGVTSGGAAGDTALTVGTVKVDIVYMAVL